MTTRDDPPPPVHLGDYPHGAYWSAERDDSAPEGEPTDHSVHGAVIRVMWDYGVRVPLWDEEGHLPEEPEWLRGALGLTDTLIEDLRGWGHDMLDLDAAPGRRTEETYAALDVRGRELAQRLQREVGSRYRVKYHQW